MSMHEALPERLYEEAADPAPSPAPAWPVIKEAKQQFPLRICLLTNQELDADPFPADDWPCDPRPFIPEATWYVATLWWKECGQEVERLVRSGKFDLYFNLCDGAEDQESPGIEVVRTLERLCVPFTGATSNFYEPTRQEMKEACARQGIHTPKWVITQDDDDVEYAARHLRFPLFVKHYSSYASVDLSRASKVVSPAGLRRQARKIMTKYGRALVEEYIDGTEYTCLVAENPDDPRRPKTYTPMQYRFPAGESFKHSKMKWVDYDQLSSFPVTDPELEAKLRDISARFFVELGGASFGRCDIRVDERGTPYMLEINPNCGVFYPPTDPGSADLCLLRDPGGHEGFARLLVESALRRNEQRRFVRRLSRPRLAAGPAPSPEG
jgi:D-alanine-D-alanine ligase